MDTVYFLPSRIEIPITNSFDQILQAAKNITTALKEHPHPRTPSSMENQAKDLHGHLTVSLGGTLDQRLATIDDMQHTSQKQDANESWTQSIFYPPELKFQ